MFQLELSPTRRWWLSLTVAVTAVVCLLLVLRGFYRHELYHFTGDAEWIWVSNQVGMPRPTAAVFTTSFVLQARPQRAVAKICGDRQYVLWINGQPVMAGRNRPKFYLDVIPVTDLLVGGENVIAIEARSSTSVGAVLFALDLDPTAEGRRQGDPMGRNVIVSNGSWGVTESWSGGLPDRIPDDTARPWVWGRPPDHPWSYPVPVLHDRPLVQAVIGETRHLEVSDFRRSGEDRWICDLDAGFAGLMWIGVRPEEGSMQVRMTSSAAAGGSSGKSALVSVVTLVGQRRWLYPGRVDGDRIVVHGPRPPVGVDLESSLDTRVR